MRRGASARACNGRRRMLVACSGRKWPPRVRRVFFETFLESCGNPPRAYVLGLRGRPRATLRSCPKGRNCPLQSVALSRGLWHTFLSSERRKAMRILAVTIATMLTGFFVAPAFAADAPTFAKCEALAEKSGSGAQGAGSRNHRQFISDCMAGKIPQLSAAPQNPTPVQTAKMTSYDKCEALADQRGAAAQGTGTRNHHKFIADCLAGKIH